MKEDGSNDFTGLSLICECFVYTPLCIEFHFELSSKHTRRMWVLLLHPAKVWQQTLHNPLWAMLLFGGWRRGWELPASHFSHWDMRSPFPDKKGLKPFSLPWQRGVGEEAGHEVAVGLTDVSQWEPSLCCVQKVLAPSCCSLKPMPYIQLASPSPCKQMCLKIDCSFYGWCMLKQDSLVSREA